MVLLTITMATLIAMLMVTIFVMLIYGTAFILPIADAIVFIVLMVVILRAIFKKIFNPRKKS